MNQSRFRPISSEIYATLGRHRQSIAKLAKAINVSTTTLQRRLISPGTFTLDELLKISKALRIRLQDFTSLLENLDTKEPDPNTGEHPNRVYRPRVQGSYTHTDASR